MPTYLDQILDATRATVARSKSLVPLAALEAASANHTPRGWARALKANSGHAVIAEIKKASPSKGLIRADFNVAQIAAAYLSGGASALSVLTDQPYFQGALENLRIASATVPLPCLRKDFIVDEYQLVEARANSADAILLIAAALTNQEMKNFSSKARALNLDVLVEVHTADELARVLDSLGSTGADAIGVNNRDLSTFNVTLDRSIELVGQIPASVLRVSESGIHSHADITRLRAVGFDAFLVGESLMREPDPALALKQLLNNI